MCEAACVVEPTAYELETKVSVRSWEQVRNQVMSAVIEGAGGYIAVNSSNALLIIIMMHN